jgi:large subunit ribosomal protein L29
MRASDIREQTREELEGKLNDIKKNLFTLKFQKAIGQVENTQAIGDLGRDIARIETLIREKELGINLGLKATKTRAKKKSPAAKKISVKKTGKKDDKKTKASSEIK